MTQSDERNPFRIVQRGRTRRLVLCPGATADERERAMAIAAELGLEFSFDDASLRRGLRALGDEE